MPKVSGDPPAVNWFQIQRHGTYEATVTLRPSRIPPFVSQSLHVAQYAPTARIETWRNRAQCVDRVNFLADRAMNRFQARIGQEATLRKRLRRRDRYGHPFPLSFLFTLNCKTDSSQ